MKPARIAVALGALAAPLWLAAQTPPIADNSFLIEEAYNQEPGVVQHISAFQLFRGADSWAYSFTQEWPLFSRKSQASFTLPVQHLPSGSASVTGVGDVALNYRYQVLDADARVAAAPRLSLLLPTGDRTAGLGTGALGAQVNLPVSVAVTRKLVSHWNAGVTVTPATSATGFNLGGSAVWLVRPAFNLLCEVAWTSADGLFVNPGIRWAHNLASGLQIVPGIAFPIGVGPSAGTDAVFLYLSLEHPFRSGER